MREFNGVDKSALRKKAYGLRKTAHDALHLAAPAQIAAHFFAALELPAGTVVAGYKAVRSEIDPCVLLEQLAAREHGVGLPVVAGQDQPLVFRSFVPGDTLVPGAFGIEVPMIDKPEVEPGALLVPVVAFNDAGVRLGCGGGFYDRTLAKLRAGSRPVIAVGLAYSGQLMEGLQGEPHDQPLDWIITERGAKKF